MKYVIYAALAVLFHLPFDTPFALLPFIPKEEPPAVIDVM